jgi:hypothetical protein
MPCGGVARRRLALLIVLGALVAALSPAGAGAAASSPLYDQASPIPGADQGSNANYRSFIVRVTPSVPGLKIQVLAFADRLQVFNHSGRTVTIYGYQGEPYARLLPDGAVQLNVRSPALYLNTSFYGGGTVPASANPAAPPQWTTVYKTGTFQWHDHRIHWASPETPPIVTNTSKRTLIFNWTVPITVGSQRGAISGQLFWWPDNSKAPVGAYVALAIVALLGLILVLWVRRRRAGPPGGVAGREGDAPTPTAAREAW